MLSFITNLLIKVAAIRVALRVLSGLLVVPLAFMLKMFGLPILAIVLMVAAPVLIVLFTLGMPVFMVLIVGGVMLTTLAVALKLGFFALKIFIFLVLPLWLAWRFAAFVRDRLWRSHEPPLEPKADATAEPA